MTNSNVEIMAPAGSWESLAAALKAGADSVYFGVGKLNMRARAANNFTIEDLSKIISLCKEKNVKTYLTLNIVYYDEELEDLRKICKIAKKEGITAVIAADLAAIEIAKEEGLEIHISTQANVSNISSVKFFSRYADVIVLARELKLEQIKNIIDSIKKNNIKGPSKELVRIELFAHGALCISLSGKCYMSLANYNHSANRGDCLQSCRRKYRVIDDETNQEMVIDNEYVMSPSDLCTIGYVDKIVGAGVKVLKIEGRGRSPDYVFAVVKAYKEAVKSLENNTYTKEKIAVWIKELESVFNRGFWHGGYYMGEKTNEWSNTYGSKTTVKKTFVGNIDNYYEKQEVASVKILTSEIKNNDEILITGPTTGVVKFKIKDIRLEEKKIPSAKKGDLISFKVSEKVRKNDKVYVLKSL